MTVILLLLLVTVSTVIVRIAAFMLELTGMPWDHAKFQALSAFSNSGYTTREAEEVMQHPMRRRIVSTLIVLGNAGIVTAIGTFAGSVMEDDLTQNLLNVGYIAAGVLVLFSITRWKGLMERARRLVQRWLSKRYDFSPPRVEELLRLDQGYGLTRVELSDSSPVVGKALMELDLKSWKVQVLAIERGRDFSPIPRGRDRLLSGDALIVYGVDDAIHKVFKPRRSRRLTVVSGPEA